jgi:hypothetical protein
MNTNQQPAYRAALMLSSLLRLAVPLFMPLSLPLVGA